MKAHRPLISSLRLSFVLSLALGAVVIGSVVAAPPAASASEIIGAPVRFGLFGGWHFTAENYDVQGSRDKADQPVGGALLGVQMGVRLIRALELQLNLPVIIADNRGGDATVVLLPVHLDLVWRPIPHAVRPYFAIGGGVVARVAGPGPGDVDALGHGAAGIEFQAGPGVTVRVEGGIYFTDGADGGPSFSPFVTAGVDILGWRESKSPPLSDPTPEPDPADLQPPPPAPSPPAPTPLKPSVDPKDPDGDGLLGDADACRLQPGTAINLGCPDSDKDGLIDPWDRCPADPGARNRGGCPDRDGDRIEDAQDACPQRAGSAASYGCPTP